MDVVAFNHSCVPPFSSLYFRIAFLHLGCTKIVH